MLLLSLIVVIITLLLHLFIQELINKKYKLFDVGNQVYFSSSNTSTDTTVIVKD